MSRNRAKGTPVTRLAVVRKAVVTSHIGGATALWCTPVDSDSEQMVLVVHPGSGLRQLRQEARRPLPQDRLVRQLRLRAQAPRLRLHEKQLTAQRKEPAKVVSSVVRS